VIRRAWILSLLPLLAGSSAAATRPGQSVQMRAISDLARSAVTSLLQAPRTPVAASRVDGCVTGALRRKLIAFRATDGVPLHGVLLGSGQNGIVLGEGGPQQALCSWLPFARTLAQRGYRVLAYDLRPLPGTPRELRRSPPKALHFARDVVGAERELVRRGVRRVLVGGAGPGGVAAMTAAAHIPRSLLAGVVVLTGVRRFGGMDAEAAARRVTAPSFFGVGSLDSPSVAEMRKLYKASAGKPKQLVLVRSSGFGTDLLLPSWAPPSFKTKLLSFIAAAFRR
jgi:pimeloyl-ACP methyl ester carboxylesterase